MKVSIRVKPNARRNEVTRLDDGTYVVDVAAPPMEGKANKMLIEILAEYFGKPKRSITIIRGGSSRNKIIDVL